MKKTPSRWAAVLLAALVVFAQFAMASGECHVAPMDEASCLAQCLGGDETVSKLAQHATAAIAAAPASLDFTLPATRFVPLPERDAPRGGPPLQILYCSYQS